MKCITGLIMCLLLISCQSSPPKESARTPAQIGIVELAVQHAEIVGIKNWEIEFKDLQCASRLEYILQGNSSDSESEAARKYTRIPKYIQALVSEEVEKYGDKICGKYSLEAAIITDRDGKYLLDKTKHQEIRQYHACVVNARKEFLKKLIADSNTSQVLSVRYSCAGIYRAGTYR